MKRLIWLGLLFLSTSWLFFMPIFEIPNYMLGLVFLSIGVIIFTISFWEQKFVKVDKKFLIILLPLLLSIYILPMPYIIGPIILMMASLLFVFLHIFKKEKINSAIMGIYFSGVILSIQTFFFPVYSIFVSHGHRIDILSEIISSISGLFSLKTSVNDGILFLQTYSKTWAVTTTWEKLGFYPWFNMLIGTLLVLFFFSKYKNIIKYLAYFVLLSGIYLIFRYILILIIFVQSQKISIFWDQMLLALSFLPFAFILMKFLPLDKIRLNLSIFKKFKFKKKQIVAICLIFIFMFSLVGAFIFQDPGTKKQGRILIDEYHSEWENTTRKMDKEWYGMLSTYNYYNWAEWLNKYYKVERNTGSLLTLNLLNNYDILVLKCPTDPYSDREIKDIIEFVTEGGGLYLIGDHTNVFGMNYYLNMVSENFGIEFLTDSTYELGTGMTSNYKTDKLFSHPVMQNVEEFEFLTSCTLKAPINSENVIIGNRLLGEPGTYSTENFFREKFESLDIEYGLLLQVAAVKHGKGRVLAFTDSTCFSNFCVFMDGYKDFNLGAIEYLNRENIYSYLNIVLVILAFVSLVGTIYIMRKDGGSHILFIFLTIGLLAISFAIPVFTHINEINYQVTTPHSEYTKICFEQEYSDVIIDNSREITLSMDNVYSTFFVWVQRVDYYPSIENTLMDAMNNGDVVVIINPIKSFTDEKIKQISEYVKKGGEILIMDSILNLDSTSNELLRGFDIQIKYNTFNFSLHNSSNTSTDSVKKPYLSIEGKIDKFFDKDNETSIAINKMGDGKVVVFVDSYTFSDEILGGRFTEPDEKLKKIYELEYYIFEKILLN